MKSKKNNYKKDEESGSLKVSEPEVVYSLNSSVPTNSPINLMGIADSKNSGNNINDTDYINLIRKGLPKNTITNLMAISGFTMNEMAAVIHTSDRTLRRYHETDKLPQEQSEKIVEMAKLYCSGADTFGSMDDFRKWMDTQLIPFGNKKPKEFMDTSIGITLIMDELGRIKHGIFI